MGVTMAIKIKIDQADIRDKVSLRRLLKAQAGDLETIIGILSAYVQDEHGVVMDEKAAREIVLRRPS